MTRIVVQTVGGGLIAAGAWVAAWGVGDSTKAIPVSLAPEQGSDLYPYFDIEQAVSSRHFAHDFDVPGEDDGVRARGHYRRRLGEVDVFWWFGRTGKHSCSPPRAARRTTRDVGFDAHVCAFLADGSLLLGGRSPGTGSLRFDRWRFSAPVVTIDDEVVTLEPGRVVEVTTMLVEDPPPEFDFLLHLWSGPVGREDSVLVMAFPSAEIHSFDLTTGELSLDVSPYRAVGDVPEFPGLEHYPWNSASTVGDHRERGWVYLLTKEPWARPRVEVLLWDADRDGRLDGVARYTADVSRAMKLGDPASWID